MNSNFRFNIVAFVAINHTVKLVSKVMNSFSFPLFPTPSLLFSSTMVVNFFRAVVLLAAATSSVKAFVASAGPVSRIQSYLAVQNSNGDAMHDLSSVAQRRSFLRELSTLVVAGSGAAVLSSLPSIANAEAETMERGGVQLTPFNSLSFNYRGEI